MTINGARAFVVLPDAISNIRQYALRQLTHPTYIRRVYGGKDS